MLAAKIHVGVEFRGIDLAKAVETDDRRVDGSVVEGWGGSSGGDVLEDVAHEGGVLCAFEEGVEGRAVLRGVKIEERGFEMEG